MSQLNGQSGNPRCQAPRLRAERDEARSNIIRIQRIAEADLQQRKDHIDDLERQLRQIGMVQRDQIQGPRETNTLQRGVNYRQSTVYNQPPLPYHNPIVPQAGQVHTRPDMLAPRPLQIPATHASRHNHNVVPPERPQVAVSANTAVAGVPNEVRFNHGVLIPPTQGQNLLPCSASKGPGQNATLYPPPHSQDPNSLPGPARLNRLSKSTNLPMPHPRNSAAQIVDRRADAVGPRKQTGPSGGSSALVVQGLDTEVQLMWSTKFSGFFKLTEAWARNYAYAPDLSKDPALTKVVIDSFAKHCNMSHVMPLLWSGSTRYLMVARMVNSWISNDLFRPEALKGFSTSIDKRMEEHQKQLTPNVSTNIRCRLLRAMADTFRELTSANDFNDCVGDRTLRQMSSLWDRLALFLSPRIKEKQAWDDLRQIFDTAYGIVALMLCNPFSFQFEYPREYFSYSCMVNRDTAYNDNPFELERRRLRIRLSITPVVRVTDFTTPDTSVRQHTVHLANVLLMQ